MCCDYDKEEKLFLYLCTSEDRERISGKREMKFYDFLRITYLISRLEMTFYEIHLNTIFPELKKKEEEMMKRHDDILKDYPEYYKDEGIPDILRKWCMDFCLHMPTLELTQKYWEKFQLDDDFF